MKIAIPSRRMLYVSLLIGSLSASLAFGNDSPPSIQIEAADVDSGINLVPSNSSQPDVEVIEHPNRYFKDNKDKFDRYRIIVATDPDDSSSKHYVKHRLAQVKKLLDKKGIPYEVVVVDPEKVTEFKKTYSQAIRNLKDLRRSEKVDEGLQDQRSYWNRIHVPATFDTVKRGIIYGVGLQALITGLTAYFIDRSAVPVVAAATGYVAIYGGVLGIWNQTFRNWLRSPDRPAPTFAKGMANSGVFAVGFKSANAIAEHGFVLGAVAGELSLLKILSHAVLSQIAKFHIVRTLLFREKYGYMSERSSFMAHQIYLFGIYLFLRLCHLHDVPYLSMGFYAMGPVGFLGYLIYKGHLAGYHRVGKRFYTLMNESTGELILTEVDKSFEKPILDANPELADLAARIERRSITDKNFREYFLRLTASIVRHEVGSVVQSISNVAKDCGLSFSAYRYRGHFP